VDLRSFAVGVAFGALLGAVVILLLVRPNVRVAGRVSARRRQDRSEHSDFADVDEARGTARFHDRRIVTTSHVALVVRLPGATVHLNDGWPRVEVDGATYHSLADVPTDAKMRLVDELGQAVDSGSLPEPARAAIEGFLAGRESAEPLAAAADAPVELPAWSTEPHVATTARAATSESPPGAAEV
jgi:hypothetical protein